MLFLIPVSVVFAGGFTAAGVQFEISLENYASEEVFFSVAENHIIELMTQNNRPDLVVFPEYIGVFFQLIRFNEIVAGHDSFQQALQEVLRKNPQFGNLSDVFINSDAVSRYLTGWSRLASEYSISIVAGSCFVSEDGHDLYNRAFVFNSDGEFAYHQDKVFLTDFESHIIGLNAGKIDEADFFEVKGRDIALTICRDTYSPSWEHKHSGAFLWVDIKANGEVYDTEQQQSFMRALPLRLIRSNVNYGITVCAVGRYLDLFWEGESTAIYKDGDKLALADVSEDYSNEDHIFLRIYTEQ